ncbi:uncharacterized protein LOC116194504 [Punica granatum]|nr:uncharacterized protein LOC116194504 [Punica granatum]
MKWTRTISLEDYVDVLHCDWQADLTISCLNQIVSMHGFRKIIRGKALKKVLVDALKTIDLIDPSRSTVKEYVSPHAFLELEEVIADLNALNWHECHTTSMKTICKENPPATKDDAGLQLKALKWKGNNKIKGKRKENRKGDDSLISAGDDRLISAGDYRLISAGDGAEKACKKRMQLLKEINAGAR